MTGGNTAFFQQIVLMVVLPFSEQAAVISVKHIRRLFFVMGTACEAEI
jgi:hypothetical protein